jgi:type IV secretion system protein VirB5
MIAPHLRGLRALLLSAALLMPNAAQAQGVPTIDLTSIAKIGQVLTEAKLQVKEMIASNLKLDAQILKQIEQIATLKAQLDALRNGLTLEALGIPDLVTFFDDILPDVADLTGGLIAAKDGS